VGNLLSLADGHAKRPRRAWAQNRVQVQRLSAVVGMIHGRADF